MNFKKNKIFLFLIFNLFLLFIYLNSGFSEIKYNETYSNITIDPDWWCPNSKAEFKIYDLNEFNNLTIKNNLCIGNETPSEDNCYQYTSITGTYKLYSGPISSLPILEEGSITDSKITYTFTSPNDYLVEIIPDGNYNQLNTRLSILECKKATEKINKSIPKIGKDFQLILNIKNLDKIDENLIKIKEENISQINSSLLENISFENTSYYLYFINLDSKNYDSFDLVLDLFNLEDEISYTILNKSFYMTLPLKEVKNKTSIYNSNDSLKDFYLLILSKNNNIIKNSSLSNLNNSNNDKDNIKNSSENISTNNILNETLNSSSNLNQNSQTNPSSKTDIEKLRELNKSKKNNSFSFLIFILLIIILGVFGMIYVKKRKNSSLINKKENQETATSNSQTEEVLTSYSRVLEETKKYINQYKDSYTKDQIYRALKMANIPLDVIEKAFDEIYNNK